jgi:hypothetical protein
MKKITPREITTALSEIIAGFKKAGPRYSAADAALWLGRARKLIQTQAAEIEALKAAAADAASEAKEEEPADEEEPIAASAEEP